MSSHFSGSLGTSFDVERLTLHENLIFVQTKVWPNFFWFLSFDPGYLAPGVVGSHEPMAIFEPYHLAPGEVIRHGRREKKKITSVSVDDSWLPFYLANHQCAIAVWVQASFYVVGTRETGACGKNAE
jgi:hypothetical protein